MESKRLADAALAAGISPNYINAHGKPQSIGADTKRRLLNAMHPAAAKKAAAAPIPQVKVLIHGKRLSLPVEGSGEFSWTLTTETGEQHQGTFRDKKRMTLPASLA